MEMLSVPFLRLLADIDSKRFNCAKKKILYNLQKNIKYIHRAIISDDMVKIYFTEKFFLTNRIRLTYCYQRHRERKRELQFLYFELFV